MRGGVWSGWVRLDATVLRGLGCGPEVPPQLGLPVVL